MSKIYVKRFGPIEDGAVDSDGWIDFAKVTAFCGPQGSGKSTVVKVFAFFTWLEKVLTRGDHKESTWLKKNKFPKEFKDFHNVSDYFRNGTILRYRGSSYEFDWENDAFSLTKTGIGTKYMIPKIMYVPAERNFMSVIEAVDQVKNIPLNLKAMIREFLEACKYFSEGISIPVPGFSFKYDKLNRIGKITLNNGGEVRLSAASSGLLSIMPLFLVSEYLFTQMTEGRDASKNMSLETYRRIMDEVFVKLSVEELPEAILQGLSQYNAALTRRFINIVEEPEQNLFPTSQARILFKLLEYVKGNEQFHDNQLVLTTHSPYIIEYLQLATLAAEKPEILVTNAKLGSGLTEKSLVRKEDVFLYETFQDGSIRRHVGADGFLPDANTLHKVFECISNDCASILEWQEGQI